MIWTSVVAAAAVLVAPAEGAGSLTLTNVRATYGVLGPARGGEKVLKILPGDQYVLCFDIDGITVGPDGKVTYGIGIEVSRSDGRVVFRQEPAAKDAPASFGGRTAPAHVLLDVGLQTQPGVKTLKVTVTDQATNATASLTRDVEVLPPDFGLVRVSITNDRDGRLPAAALGVGQAAWLQLGAVGFARPGGDQPPAVSFSLRFLDEAGKPTQAKPIEVPALKGHSPGQTLVPVQFLLSPNRPGKFTAEITATDEVGKKTATLSVPLTVVEAK